MWRVLLSMALAGCGDAPPEAAPPAPAPAVPSRPGPGAGGPGGPVPNGGPKGLSEAEDLRSSWRPALAVGVPPLAGDDCPDADGDGFPAAGRCDRDPATLDCDDADPAITPAVERWVPPGPFVMGSASDHAGRDERPVHVVTLAGYCLDVYEATADAVGGWAARTGRRLRGPDLANVDPAGAPTPGKETHPATGLTWAEARAFCGAQGKALPTEAQWEKAARGGCERGDDPTACDPADLRPYPWGTAAPDCSRANHQQLGAGGPPKLCAGGTLPVDALPDGSGPYGHAQLAGNAWEWVSDPWHPGVYREAQRTDPAGPAAGEHHVLRGGGWSTFPTNMRAANRFHDLVMGSPAGVRCARPTVEPTPDPVPALAMVAVSGRVTHASGALSGRALYVTAFDAADADPRTGLLTPGRSPVAERRLDPAGGAEQAFQLEVPAGGRYLVSAAMDAGAPAGADFVAPSGTGGMGQADQNPVAADGDVTGLTIRIEAPPAGGPAGSRGPNGPGPGPGPRRP